ncbi:Energy-coupling factor transporter ATP-binding protein EcfA2 [compost metagenome]
MFYNLHQERGLTTILVTHSMEDAARYADNIVIMHEGKNVLSGTPQEIFKDVETLKNFRLEPPRIVRFQQKIEQMMKKPLQKVCLTEEELASEVARMLREERAES